MIFFGSLLIFKKEKPLSVLQMEAGLFTLEKRLRGKKPCVSTGFGGCVLERVPVLSEEPGLRRALNEC